MISDDRFLQVPWRVQEPQRLQKEDINHILQWASQTDGISDIVLSSGNPAAALRFGNVCFLMRRPLGDVELLSLANEITGNGGSIIKSGQDYDFRHRVHKPDLKGYYFSRVNMTQSVMGPSITFRLIPEVPPEFDEYGFEPELRNHLFPRHGMVLMAGETGSGKTTALASIIRRRLTSESINFISYESPPEYDFYQIPDRVALVTQTDIPLDLPNYVAAVRNSLRRAPQLVLVGEARDHETISGAVAEVRTGHALLSTVHTPSAHGTIDRMVSLFPPDEARAAQVSLVDALSVIIHQRLVASTDGRRVALREWIVFTHDLKLDLIRLEPSEVGPFLQQHINNPENRNCRSVTESARRLHVEGKISDLVLQEVMYSAGMAGKS